MLIHICILMGIRRSHDADMHMLPHDDAKNFEFRVLPKNTPRRSGAPLHELDRDVAAGCWLMLIILMFSSLRQQVANKVF